MESCKENDFVYLSFGCREVLHKTNASRILVTLNEKFITKVNIKQSNYKIFCIIHANNWVLFTKPG